MRSYNILGLMSGTSLDGLDISYCSYHFDKTNDNWTYDLHHSETFAYESEILYSLAHSKELNACELAELSQQLGETFAKLITKFISNNKLRKDSIDLISSHGHTIYHQPHKKITIQIGCGETIASRTGIPVVNDFRSKDVINGGQGAPLVPIGDLLLFNDSADSFLNIGGFSNICIIRDKISAFDIGPGNLPLNYLSREFGVEYDKNGELAREGKLNPQLLDELCHLPYFKLTGPKSLGTEWLDSEFLPIVDKYEIDAKSKLRTIVEVIALEIANTLNKYSARSVFITGGGAKNRFLIERIKDLSSCEVTLPNNQLIDFKEAIVFGLLGALYLEDKPNCLAEVTGASHNVIGGAFHRP